MKVKKATYRGFSIMEVMVAMGLLGVLTFAFMQYQKSSIASQKQNEQSNALSAVEARIISQLASADACTETIKQTGSFFNPDTTSKVAQKFSAVRNGISKTILTAGDTIDAKKKIVFNQIDFHKVGTNYLMTFKFKNTSTGRDLVKDFVVDYAVDGAGIIKSCTGQSNAELEKTKDESVVKSCESLGGIYNGESCTVDKVEEVVKNVEVLEAKVTTLESQLAGLQGTIDEQFGKLFDNAHTQAECRNLSTVSGITSATVVNQDGSKVCVIEKTGDGDVFSSSSAPNNAPSFAIDEGDKFQPGLQGACPTGWRQYKYCTALRAVDRSYGIPGSTRSFQLPGRDYSCEPIIRLLWRKDSSGGTMIENDWRTGDWVGRPFKQAVYVYAASVKDDGDDRRYARARTPVYKAACY